ALAAALRHEPERILVLGSSGGRLDHLFGSLLVLAAEAYAGVQVDAQLGAAAVHVVRGERRLAGEPGELISLFAVHGAASGVVTEGLVYPLRGETLKPGSTRGLSNVFAEPEARRGIERGVLVAVRPAGCRIVSARPGWRRASAVPTRNARTKRCTSERYAGSLARRVLFAARTSSS